jgi:hypothetical protein
MLAGSMLQMECQASLHGPGMCSAAATAAWLKRAVVGDPVRMRVIHIVAMRETSEHIHACMHVLEQ